MLKIVMDTDPQTAERRMAVRVYLRIHSVVTGLPRPTERELKKGSLVREPRPDPENEAKIKNRNQCTAEINALFEELLPEPEDEVA
jgi:hypothetical protein